MYLALRWLIFMSLTMWIIMCCFDNLNMKSLIKPVPQPKKYNISEEIAKTTNKVKTGHKHHSTISFHYGVFVAGALLLTVYNRHNIKIKKYVELDPRLETWCEKAKLWTSMHLKETATAISVVMQKNLILGREYYKLLIIFLRKHKHKLYFLDRKGEVEMKHYKLNLLLIKKMKDIGEERKQLAQLLISAINENKNIRALYHLETLCKSRLQRQIECTNKEIKENRSLYNNYQQLYVVVHRENIYLKERIKRISKHKNECENKLMCVVNEVFRSNHMYLKEFCSKLIVNTRENLVTNGANREINEFLQNYKTKLHKTEDEIKDTKNKFNDENVRDEHLQRIVTEIPKFKGLPGEYVWTVKDKLGLIGKLYEYDFESNLESGDTLRRIREYTVYHDRDCFLDHRQSKTNSNSVITELPGCPKPNVSTSSITSKENKFLTGSVAFKNFLKNSSQMSIPFGENI